MIRATRTLFTLTLIAASLLLEGCGFQLRGALELPQDIRSVQVTAPLPLKNDILAILESGGVDTAAADADARITVDSERFSRRVLSVDPNTGKEREFELAYTISFGVARRDGTQVIENGIVNLLRDYIFDPEAVIGSSSEEGLLRDEMRRDAARQMLRRVEAALTR